VTTCGPQEQVLLDVTGDTAYVTLNRPDRRNALRRSVHHELGAVLSEVRGHSGVRFVVLSGNGGAFSSGGDLEELRAGLPDDYISDYGQRMRASVTALRQLDQVVVARVEGAAVGAGAALALAADVVVLDAEARLRFSFGHVGFVPDNGATLSLVRAVGLPVARDLLLTGRWIAAEEAAARGLVARVAPAGESQATVAELLGELRSSPARSAAMTKDLLESLGNPAFESGVRAEGVAQFAASRHPEHAQHVRDRLSR
jgi:2-(1,2-epoxy-1,2-dihydrophenyl)acetyl-CoA isomerase